MLSDSPLTMGAIAPETISQRIPVTLAICTFNRAPILKETLEQVCNLRISPSVDLEVLVVDNNSTDSTPDVLSEMSARLPLRGLREPKPGQSHARNLVLREARGQFILWTDDDVLLENDWLTVILDTFAHT